MRKFYFYAVFIISVIASGTVLAECNWVKVNDKYCSENVTLQGQSGYTLGEDFEVHTRIQDDATRPNARNLPIGASDIFVDRYGMCRYIGNGGMKEYFVPFRTASEWASYLDNLPNDAWAVTCARLLPDVLHSVCGDVAFNWQRGKQGDRQTSIFEFQRAQEWKFECGSLREPNQTTTCDVNLSWDADAHPLPGALKPSERRAAWSRGPEPTLDSQNDCEPPKPAIPCGYAITVAGGDEGLADYDIFLGDENGPVTVSYNTYARPDNITLSLGRKRVQTGWVGDRYYYSYATGPSVGSFTMVKIDGDPTTASLSIATREQCTVWQVSVSCPGKNPARLTPITNFPSCDGGSTHDPRDDGGSDGPNHEGGDGKDHSDGPENNGDKDNDKDDDSGGDSGSGSGGSGGSGGGQG